MNNNIDIANFDKMLELAEFGAKRHNERRQNLFKFVISYVTLLVLALYQTFKNETLLIFLKTAEMSIPISDLRICGYENAN